MHASSLRKTLMAMAALVLAAVAAAPLSASAQTWVSLRSGAWEAFDGTSDDGRQVCGVSTSSRDGRRYFGIKYFDGSRSLVVHLMSDAWAIPDDTPVRVSLRFGDAAPWNASAVGAQDLIEARLSGSENVRQFIGEFSTARSDRVEFEGGERPWAISLDGSRPALDAMVQCMRRLIAAGGGRDGGGDGTRPRQEQRYARPYAQPNAQPREQPDAQPYAQRGGGTKAFR